jgi:NAD(P)-dependent dehydrogenase (short-subunit alcohol dehydrogenase family)
MTLHLRGPLLLLKYALPEMIGRRAGRILLITSPAGNGTHTSLSAYCLGKGAQTHLAAQVDCEAREFGVRAFAVDPGLAFTKMANDTVSDLAALHFLPEMVQRLRFLSGNASNASALQRCGERCVRLVSGKYDQLAGRFLPNEIDLDELLERMQRADREIHDPDGGQQR